MSPPHPRRPHVDDHGDARPGGAGEEGPHVVAVNPADTYELRRTVLRKGAPSSAVAYPGDDGVETRHLAVRIGHRIVAVSTWIPGSFPGAAPDRAPGPDGPGLQLRGMATAPEARGRGFGSLLLDAGRRRAEEIGAGVLWARARSTALTFYLERGFEAVGDDFIDDTSGLPHRLVRWTRPTSVADGSVTLITDEGQSG